jgi:predicted methyltransferase
MQLDLTFYAVRNHEGKWFRAKGYNGGGNSWVDSIQKARIYANLGPARSIVTWWSGHGMFPELIALKVNEGIVMNEEQRVNDVIQKKKEAVARNEEWRAKERIKEAERDLKQAQEKLKSLKK